MVINGYEWTERGPRLPGDAALLRLSVAVDGPAGAARSGAGPTSKRPGRAAAAGRSACSVGSAADTFAAEQGGPNVDVVRFDGATDAMTAVQNGQYDATLQDLPAARFYAERFPGLELVGPPESHGYYVIYVRKEDADAPRCAGPGHARLIASGELRRLYETYGIWTEAQDELSAFTGPIEPVSGRRDRRRLGAAATVSAPAARRGVRDRSSSRSPRCRWRWRSACWSRSAGSMGPAAASCPDRLRRADPGHAADAPALRAVLPC